jgi:hypothetical protein
MNALAHVSRIIVRRVSSGLEAIPGIDASCSLYTTAKKRIELEESGCTLCSRCRRAP